MSARSGSGQTARIDPTTADLASLMRRVQDGDQGAFATLYDHLAPAVYGAALRVVRDPALAQDITQEAFVELWRTAARFDPTRGSVLPWAVTIVRRRAIDRVRAEESQRDRIAQLATRRDDEAGDVGDPGDTVVSTLDARRVRRALLLLPPDQRDVIGMAFLDGHSHAVIAEHLHLPLGTVKSRIRGALQRLATALREDA